jgi:hypothetical protein
MRVGNGESIAFCYGLPAKNVKETVFFQPARVIVSVHRRNAARSKLAPTGFAGLARKSPYNRGVFVYPHEASCSNQLVRGASTFFRY